MRRRSVLTGSLVASAGAAVLLVGAAGARVVPSAPSQAVPVAVSIGNDLPSWSPDGRRIAFVGFRNGRVGDIFTIGPDGRGERRLTNTPQHEDMPRWSPDGRRIAYVRATGGANFHIFVMNADGSGQTQVTRDASPNFSPVWSPDGTKIAFVSTRDRLSSHIFVVDADGGNEIQLTQPMRAASGVQVRNDSPDWSPDGRLIAFASNRSDLVAWRLYTMRPDGSDVRPLTQDPIPWNNELRPAWSPDGSKVAFVSGPGRFAPVDNSEIMVVNADGSGEVRLTRNLRADKAPSWSPDGRRLAIVGELGQLRPEIYLIPATRLGTPQKLTGGTLRFARLRTVPPASAPAAGKPFGAVLEVTPALTGMRRFADVACYAFVGQNELEAAFGSVVNGRVHCTWLVPRGSQGKRLEFIAAARFGHSTVLRKTIKRIE